MVDADEQVRERVRRDYWSGDLYVTENGAAYPDPPPQGGRLADPERLRYYAGHLAATARAIAAGIPLKGYFAWSLLDNFEWAHRYAKRFGIVRVDHATLARTPKDSARFYAGVARDNAVAPPP